MIILKKIILKKIILTPDSLEEDVDSPGRDPDYLDEGPDCLEDRSDPM
jgi:hypothetical protein